ncbi:CIC11C00000003555 [Sungouiella intermedia]|uniref:CIC11C00000003555 n=1 Tax=Sungouiella intermedia TaxID=45354 RepID=A0A1L0DN00_9ASCO|nr:CIC11C00000003555 [[Candida] intermedia]
MLKTFRKSKRLSNSLNSSKHSISRVTSTQYTTDELDLVLKSPKKVIKALYDYLPQGPGELRFNKGDFFHVLGDVETETEGEGWYDATNPATQQRGMVPMSHFEVFNRTRPANPDPGHSIEQSNPINAKLHHVAAAGGKQSNQTLYGVTLYDFKAEREDELDIVPGENLVICAHHDYEWFIAKPITRLGGPGLVPALYVKIIDMMLTSRNLQPDDDVVSVINHFKIPTVEEWKDQTAKYQALTIPLGHISNSSTAVMSSNSQYFQKDTLGSNRSLLTLTRTTIVEASVDSYHLEHGRYQYLVTARLSNGKTRYLYRFYQDFYDLQVRLLELFPYEAGKIENSRRIIPSIPGPLINVNDSISKLRREKLDYYLRNLIALPLHISRCEDVLALFEVINNGFDKEVTDNKADRSSKPIKQQSNSQQDRLSQYSNMARQGTSTPPLLDSPLQRSTSSSSTNLLHQTAPEKLAKVKVKFYYEDDIFVLLLPVNLRLQDLKTKLVRRLGLESEEGNGSVYLFLKHDYDEFMDNNNATSEVLAPELRERLFTLEIDDDTKFHGLLYDKCKVVILSG